MSQDEVDSSRDHTEVATIDGRKTAAEAEPDDRARGSSRALPTERYRVVNRLGKGGMGEVMLVRDQAIGREVALKRMRKANPSDRLIERFLREASIQGRLEHPAIVPLYDLGRDEVDQPFFTMKKLAGTTLAKILGGDRQGHTLQRLLRAFTEVCLAVEFAHTRGVIHRDLKPDNIVLGDFGEVYVLDWGVAKVIGEPDGEFADVGTGSADGDERATLPGAIVGTPGYMAPEQVRGLVDVDARADVYALGCILFEILAHQMLHPTGKPGLASAVSGLTEPRPSVRAPERVIPPELDELCVRATEAERAHRIASARELGDRVQQFLDGDRDLAMRRQLASEHLANAQAAFAAGDTGDHRQTAMREAASALALDPALTAAAELVGRLMIEPPRTTPREVEDAILEDDIATMRSHARVAVGVYAAFLAFVPLLWWIGPPSSPYVAALAGIVVVSMGICYLGSRIRPIGLESVLALTNTVLLVIVARMFTPFLVAPALAAMSVMGIVFTPTRSRITSALGMTVLPCLAVLGPWLLERTGTLAVTTTVDAHGILLRAAGTAGDETRTLVVGALYVIALLASAALMAHGMRARERAAKRHLHLQAWQLRQLVPHESGRRIATVG